MIWKTFSHVTATALFCMAMLHGVSPIHAATRITVAPTAPMGMFTPDNPPRLNIEVASDVPIQWKGQVLVQQFDLLDETRQTTRIAIELDQATAQQVVYSPMLANGVYRLEISLTETGQDQPITGVNPVRQFIAYAPARLAGELPDDWPIATHVSPSSFASGKEIIQPGFKWYRVFTHWSQNNPDRGVYNWDNLDRVVQAVKQAGGKILITDDTTPAWAVGEDHRNPISWVKGAVSNPPDDMNDLRVYLRELLKRYDSDGSGVIGGLEAWNEANTSARWSGTYAQLAEVAKIMREEAAQSPSHPLVVGIAVSAGQHLGYINGVIDAGQLQYVDAISGHWYEEMFTYSKVRRLTSIYTQWQNLHDPMIKAGYNLPIWDTESGIRSVERENGRLIPQNQINKRDEAQPDFNPQEPWKIGKKWRMISEQRAASAFVSGIVRLMSLNVAKIFTYQHYGFYRDGSTTLQWVTVNVLGEALQKVDYHKVSPVNAIVTGKTSDIGAMAFRVGDAAGSRFILAWAYQVDDTVGKSKYWQPWLEPQPLRIAVNTPSVTVTDLYGRRHQQMQAVGGYVTILAGEEPVYLWEQE